MLRFSGLAYLAVVAGKYLREGSEEDVPAAFLESALSIDVKALDKELVDTQFFCAEVKLASIESWFSVPKHIDSQTDLRTPEEVKQAERQEALNFNSAKCNDVPCHAQAGTKLATLSNFVDPIAQLDFAVDAALLCLRGGAANLPELSVFKGAHRGVFSLKREFLAENKHVAISVGRLLCPKTNPPAICSRPDLDPIKAADVTFDQERHASIVFTNSLEVAQSAGAAKDLVSVLIEPAGSSGSYQPRVGPVPNPANSNAMFCDTSRRSLANLDLAAPHSKDIKRAIVTFPLAGTEDKIADREDLVANPGGSMWNTRRLDGWFAVDKTEKGKRLLADKVSMLRRVGTYQSASIGVDQWNIRNTLRPARGQTPSLPDLDHLSQNINAVRATMQGTSNAFADTDVPALDNAQELAKFLFASGSDFALLIDGVYMGTGLSDAPITKASPFSATDTGITIDFSKFLPDPTRANHYIAGQLDREDVDECYLNPEGGHLKLGSEFRTRWFGKNTAIVDGDISVPSTALESVASVLYKDDKKDVGKELTGKGAAVIMAAFNAQQLELSAAEADAINRGTADSTTVGRVTYNNRSGDAGSARTCQLFRDSEQPLSPPLLVCIATETATETRYSVRRLGTDAKAEIMEAHSTPNKMAVPTGVVLRTATAGAWESLRLSSNGRSVNAVDVTVRETEGFIPAEDGAFTKVVVGIVSTGHGYLSTTEGAVLAKASFPAYHLATSSLAATQHVFSGPVDINVSGSGHLVATVSRRDFYAQSQAVALEVVWRFGGDNLHVLAAEMRKSGASSLKALPACNKAKSLQQLQGLLGFMNNDKYMVGDTNTIKINRPTADGRYGISQVDYSIFGDFPSGLHELVSGTSVSSQRLGQGIRIPSSTNPWVNEDSWERAWVLSQSLFRELRQEHLQAGQASAANNRGKNVMKAAMFTQQDRFPAKVTNVITKLAAHPVTIEATGSDPETGSALEMLVKGANVYFVGCGSCLSNQGGSIVLDVPVSHLQSKGMDYSAKSFLNRRLSHDTCYDESEFAQLDKILINKPHALVDQPKFCQKIKRCVGGSLESGKLDQSLRNLCLGVDASTEAASESQKKLRTEIDALAKQKPASGDDLATGLKDLKNELQGLKQPNSENVQSPSGGNENEQASEDDEKSSCC